MTDNLDSAIQELTEHAANLFATCHERGMQLPYFFCCVASNGAAHLYRFDGADSPMQVLAEHDRPEGLRLPLNIVVLDQAGDAVHAVIKTDGASVTR